MTLKPVSDKQLAPVSILRAARMYCGEPAEFSKAVQRIQEASSPVIIAGMGVRWDKAYPQLQSLAEKIGAPVFCTPKAKGALPENHPYSAGVFIGGKLEMDILGKADLIVGVGLDPADMLAKPWKYSQPMVTIDRVSNYNEIYHSEMELVGNVAEILTVLTEALPADHKWDETVAPCYRQKVYNALAMRTKGLAARCAEIGWHLDFLLPGWLTNELLDALGKLKLDFTCAHMGMFLARDGVGQPGFQRFLELLKHGAGHCYAKFTGIYRMSVAPGFADVAPMARALIEAAPDRLIWGSDFPHLSFADRVSSVELFNLLGRWAPDDETRRKILVSNPQRLFGFASGKEAKP